jgi:hypothetical protein
MQRVVAQLLLAGLPPGWRPKPRDVAAVMAYAAELARERIVLTNAA